MEQKFFIPKITEGEEVEKIYSLIKNDIEAEESTKISEERIFRICFTDKFDKTITIEVGQTNHLTDEIVIAVLKGEAMYYIITPSRGIKRNGVYTIPLLVNFPPISEVVLFFPE